MAIKFSKKSYWNPSEWVSRTLFRAIERIPSEKVENDELIIIQEIKRQIQLYVWLLNCENYQTQKLERLKALVIKSREYEQIPSEYEEVYTKQFKKILTNINESIKWKSS